MSNGFIDNATISNTNKVLKDSTLTDSTLTQGRIEVNSGATLRHNITISSTADNLDMINSTLDMCGVLINSDDSTEDITKTCSISDTKIISSTVTIAGS